MVAWPAELPQDPLLAGYGDSPPETAIRTPMDVGPDKIRRRITAGVKPVAFSLDLTQSQKERLELFYETDTSGGSVRFDWVDHGATGTPPVEYHFRAPPSFRRFATSTKWIAALALEIMP